jgi:hypothetical protein
MKKINSIQSTNLIAGSRASSIIAGVSCVASGFWPIGTIIFGPTCAGMIFASWYD